MFGPLFRYELIRLARKGRTALFRCLYLGLLLIVLGILYQATPGSMIRGDYLATFATVYSTVLFVIQYLMVLCLTPVYMASTIAEEKENQTLDLLFQTQLSDAEIVLGKLAARVMHLAGVVLAAVPVLAFVQFCGGVDPDLLIYHCVQALLLLLSASCLCVWASTESRSVLDAIVFSAALCPALGLSLILVFVFTLPAISGTAYWIGYLLSVPAHLVFSTFFAFVAVRRMRYLRRSSFTRPPKPVALRESKKTGELVPVAHSRIHPLARPIGTRALVWKEFLKDGNWLSLTFWWPGAGVTAVVFLGMVYQGVVALLGDWIGTEFPAGLAYLATYAVYFIALSALALIAGFESAMTVVCEREQGTLEFLLLLPESRLMILLVKWLGCLYRNWPLLAVGYLGVLLGLACGLYSPMTALVLALLPWPALLFATLLGLMLSVLCRRVLYANLTLALILVGIVAAHLLLFDDLVRLLRFYAMVMFELDLSHLPAEELDRSMLLGVGEQLLLLAGAVGCGAAAFLRFNARRDETRGLAW